MSQSKFYVFTTNKPDATKKWPRQQANEGDDVVWCVSQPEKGAEGTCHIQGAVAFANKKRLAQLVKKYPGTHWERMNGTCAQSLAYCTKEDSYFPFDGYSREQWGVMPAGQGARGDIAELKEMIKVPGGLKRIAEERPEDFLRYTKLAQWGALLRPERVDAPREVIIHYGPPGSGKSRKAREDHPDPFTPAQNNAGMFSFEGYDGQTTILIDDLEPGNMTAGALKIMTDRYKNKLPGRGVSPDNNADVIYITSNTDPRVWFPKDPTFWPALVRRATKIIFCQEHEWTTEVSYGKELLVVDRVRIPGPYFLL